MLQRVFIAALAALTLLGLMETADAAAPAAASGRSALVFYDSSSGVSESYELGSDGTLSGRSPSEGASGFDLVISADVDGDGTGEVVRYDADGGQPGRAFGSVDQGLVNGQRVNLLSSATWRSGWDEIVAVDWTGDGTEELLFYDGDARRAEVFDVQAGRMRSIYSSLRWKRGWDQIVAMDLDGDNFGDLVLYDADGGDSGRGRSTILRGSATGVRKVSVGKRWRSDWDTIIAGNWSTDTGSELMLYSAVRGAGTIQTVSNAGRLGRVYSSERWSKGWDSIVGLDLNEDAFTDVVFYDSTGGDPGRGRGRFYFGRSESIRTAGESTRWRSTWDVLVPSSRSLAATARPIPTTTTTTTIPPTTMPPRPTTTSAAVVPFPAFPTCHPDYFTPPCVPFSFDNNSVNCPSVGFQVRLKSVQRDPYRLDQGGVPGLGCESYPVFGAAPPTTRPAPAPVPPPAPTVSYRNCAAARAAGAAPIRRGQPGYGRHLDRDGDGIGCE